MSDVNEEYYDEFDEFDDDDNLYMNEDFVRHGGCNCEYCETGREMLNATDADKKDASNRPSDFINGILEDEQVRHKFYMERNKLADERIKLAMSFIEQQGVASVIVANSESHRLDEVNLSKLDRERAISAAFNYITGEFTKKKK